MPLCVRPAAAVSRRENRGLLASGRGNRRESVPGHPPQRPRRVPPHRHRLGDRPSESGERAKDCVRLCRHAPHRRLYAEERQTPALHQPGQRTDFRPGQRARPAAHPPDTRLQRWRGLPLQPSRRAGGRNSHSRAHFVWFAGRPAALDATPLCGQRRVLSPGHRRETGRRMGLSGPDGAAAGRVRPADRGRSAAHQLRLFPRQRRDRTLPGAACGAGVARGGRMAFGLACGDDRPAGRHRGVDAGDRCVHSLPAGRHGLDPARRGLVDLLGLQPWHTGLSTGEELHRPGGRDGLALQPDRLGMGPDGKRRQDGRCRGLCPLQRHPPAAVVQLQHQLDGRRRTRPALPAEQGGRPRKGVRLAGAAGRAGHQGGLLPHRPPAGHQLLSRPAGSGCPPSPAHQPARRHPALGMAAHLPQPDHAGGCLWRRMV